MFQMAMSASHPGAIAPLRPSRPTSRAGVGGREIDESSKVEPAAGHACFVQDQ